MRHYEIVVMVSAEQHDRATAMAQRYQSMIADGGGAVHRFEDWGSRQLAYPIGKRARARYFLFNIECGADTLNQLKEDFRYSESVIRSLVIRCEEAIKDDSPILSALKNATKDDSESDAEGSSDSENSRDSKDSAPEPAQQEAAADKEVNDEEKE